MDPTLLFLLWCRGVTCSQVILIAMSAVGITIGKAKQVKDKETSWSSRLMTENRADILLNCIKSKTMSHPTCMNALCLECMGLGNHSFIA